MSYNEKWTNGYVRLTNPQCHRDPSFLYEGPIAEYQFGTQQNNYERIAERLARCNLQLSTINVVKWTTSYGGNRTKFICLSDDDCKFVWYKYETYSSGSGNNVVYYGKKKMKTTEFLNMDESELQDFLSLN